MPKTFTNDQGYIIKALARKDYKYVWEQVKYIGYNKVRDINTRNLIFYDIVTKFDYKKNNNFIYYYSRQLGFNKMDENETYFVTRTRGVIATLKNELISPTDNHGGSKIVEEFYEHWC